MREDPVDRALKQHYQRQMLSAEAMARMAAMADSVSQKQTQQQRANFWQQRWGFQRKLSLLASLMVALLLIPLLWPADETLLVRVAKEVALNHNKQLASDYLADSYQQLASVMDKLDFELRPSVRLQQAGYRVVGARYCSIQGEIAAQLKLLSAGGELVTLYQTRLTPALAALGEQRYTAGRLEVQTWQEGDAFFGLASSSPQWVVTEVVAEP